MKQKFKRKKTNQLKSKIILFIFDIIGIFISLYIGFILANFFNNIVGYSTHEFLKSISNLYSLYIIIPMVFIYEGIYTNRYDFWVESRIIIKSLVLSLVIVFAYLAITQSIQEYSRSVILFSFMAMIFVIPSIKNILKKQLFKIGIWKMGVKVVSQNEDISDEIFNNHYLGYIKSRRDNTDVVFFDSTDVEASTIKKKLETALYKNKQVMFIPLINNYQFKSSDIYELTNTRTNLIVIQNRLNSKVRKAINIIYNYILAIILLPLLMPIVGIISFLIKKDSKGSAFFKQDRLGLDGKIFTVYKFRTMYEDGEKILKDYLDKNPQEIENYNIYCKYDNDPRITKIGNFLRKTSLDELAQIFNVLKGEMNFVGPRPYLVTESDKIGKINKDIILKAKPGITGLWQVSGRNELTFEQRVEIDKWYINNWSTYRDIVILIKTIKVVLNKAGAK